MTYPVHWDKYQILRDFVQNFYDSVGYEEWNSRFRYSYNESKLCMEVEDSAFSYEWLMHIGASSKTAASEKYAGYFGEGFKIASLCAYRDFGWKIHMASDDWELDVGTVKNTIEDTTVEMLSYKVRTVEKAKNSRLILENIMPEDYMLFHTVLKSFFYPENEMIGKEIFKSEKCAVYLRSKSSIDPNLPVTKIFNTKGAVFCGYQMLGTNPFDLVVCLHDYKKEDRERRPLYDFEVIYQFEKIARLVDSECAVIMLEKMKRYWNTRPSCKYDIHSWKNVIDALVTQISKSKEVTDEFIQKYPNLVCCPSVYTVSDKNRRDRAKVWLKQQTNSYRMVRGIFLKLGVPSIEQICEANEGFISEGERADSVINKGFAVIENICRNIFSDYFVVEKWPEYSLIPNISATYNGMADLKKNKNIQYNITGLKVRYLVQKIYLNKNVFRSDEFFTVLSTYVRELCHMFGGESSESFTLALTHSIEILLKNRAIVMKGRDEWIQLFADEVKL